MNLYLSYFIKKKGYYNIYSKVKWLISIERLLIVIYYYFCIIDLVSTTKILYTITY